MRTKKRINKGDIVKAIGYAVVIVLLIANLFMANSSQNNPITPPGGETSDTAISISDDTEIEVKIYYYTIFGVNKEAYYNWDDGPKNNLSKKRHKIEETLEVPDDSGIHKLTIVYGENEYVYYYKVEES